MDRTKIAWTDATWNPIVGCSKISAGCANCYAERMDKRIRAARGEEWREWSAANSEYNVRVYPERIEQPLHWKKPRRIFVNSMSDLFHPFVPYWFINAVFEGMGNAPQHTFQVLTKRPEQMLKWYRITNFFGRRDYLSNVWLGVSVENQRAADERIPLLLQMPAAVRFVSCEPLLDMIDLSKWFADELPDVDSPRHWQKTANAIGINWVIAGGESGPKFRPMNLDWARSLRDQCVGADVPFFFKQESGLRPATNPMLDGVEWHQFPRGKTTRRKSAVV